MERMEEMLILNNQLDFREVGRAVPLISASRWLVRRGEVTRYSIMWRRRRSRRESILIPLCTYIFPLFRIWWKDNAEAKLTFGRRVNRQTLTLFLFTDLLVVTRKKR